MKKKFISFNDDDSVGKYLKDVRKSIILTPAEEISLAKRIKDGDTKAIDELVKSNLKFVISIAKDYQGQGLQLSDLISEGNYGLIKAANRFDYTRGFRFISYAVWWIRQSIIQSLNDNARVVRLPVNVIAKLAYLKKEIEKFEYLNEREPVFGEVFDKDNESMVLLRYPKCASLNDTINEDGDELGDIISIDEEEVEIYVDEKVKKELDNTLAILTDRERDIIEAYFGINTICAPMTLEAIGEKYGLTKERIRQVKSKALRKLRHNTHNLYCLINE